MASSARPRDRSLRVVLATRSEGKTHELRSLLQSMSSSRSVAGLTDDAVEVVTLDDAGIAWSADEDAIESFATFEENALAKARWYSRHLAEFGPGDVVFADDSGLAVDALHGAPGIHSKRWAGHDALEGLALDAANNRSLLDALVLAHARGAVSRAARYVCVAAAVWPGGECLARGEVVGELLREPRGDGGFGYDPYFWSPEVGATFAEVTREVKAGVSHRGRAFRALVTALDARGVWCARGA